MIKKHFAIFGHFKMFFATMAFAISKSAQFDRGQKLHCSKKFKLQFSLKESYQSFFLSKILVQIFAQQIETLSEFFSSTH